MRWDFIADQLEATFTVERLRTEDGLVLTSANGEPLDIGLLLVQATEPGDEDDQELGYLIAELQEYETDAVNPATALEILAQRWHVEVLIDASWEGFGPVSSGADLELLDVGKSQAYVLLLQEEQPLRALAAIRPGSSARAISAFFLSLLEDNGGSYGVELFGSLPTETTNHRPDLIPVLAVWEAYWRWMQWATEEYGAEVWTDLQDTLIYGLLESHPLRRASRILRELPLSRLGRPKEVLRWLRARREEGEELSPEDRMRIFANYFLRSYMEGSD
jgi:hypothetical protein